jgi:hypothetical protein
MGGSETGTSFAATIVAIEVFLFCLFKKYEGDRKYMKDRTQQCIYYVCKDADCRKGFVNVEMTKNRRGQPAHKSAGLPSSHFPSMIRCGFVALNMLY